MLSTNLLLFPPEISATLVNQAYAILPYLNPMRYTTHRTLRDDHRREPHSSSSAHRKSNETAEATAVRELTEYLLQLHRMPKQETKSSSTGGERPSLFEEVLENRADVDRLFLIKSLRLMVESKKNEVPPSWLPKNNDNFKTMTPTELLHLMQGIGVIETGLWDSSLVSRLLLLQDRPKQVKKAIQTLQTLGDTSKLPTLQAIKVANINPAFTMYQSRLRMTNPPPPFTPAQQIQMLDFMIEMQDQARDFAEVQKSYIKCTEMLADEEQCKIAQRNAEEALEKQHSGIWSKIKRQKFNEAWPTWQANFESDFDKVIKDLQSHNPDVAKEYTLDKLKESGDYAFLFERWLTATERAAAAEEEEKKSKEQKQGQSSSSSSSPPHEEKPTDPQQKAFENHIYDICTDSFSEYLKIEQRADVQDAVYQLHNACNFAANVILEQLKKDSEYELRRNEYMRKFNRVLPHRQNKAVATATFTASDTFRLVRGGIAFFTSHAVLPWVLSLFLPSGVNQVAAVAKFASVIYMSPSLSRLSVMCGLVGADWLPVFLRDKPTKQLVDFDGAFSQFYREYSGSDMPKEFITLQYILRAMGRSQNPLVQDAMRFFNWKKAEEDFKNAQEEAKQMHWQQKWRKDIESDDYDTFVEAWRHGIASIALDISELRHPIGMILKWGAGDLLWILNMTMPASMGAGQYGVSTQELLRTWMNAAGDLFDIGHQAWTLGSRGVPNWFKMFGRSSSTPGAARFAGETLSWPLFYMGLPLVLIYFLVWIAGFPPIATLRRATEKALLKTNRYTWILNFYNLLELYLNNGTTEEMKSALLGSVTFGEMLYGYYDMTTSCTRKLLYRLYVILKGWHGFQGLFLHCFSRSDSIPAGLIDVFYLLGIREAVCDIVPMYQGGGEVTCFEYPFLKEDAKYKIILQHLREYICRCQIFPFQPFTDISTEAVAYAQRPVPQYWSRTRFANITGQLKKQCKTRSPEDMTKEVNLYLCIWIDLCWAYRCFYCKNGTEWFLEEFSKEREDLLSENGLLDPAMHLYYRPVADQTHPLAPLQLYRQSMMKSALNDIGHQVGACVMLSPSDVLVIEKGIGIQMTTQAIARQTIAIQTIAAFTPSQNSLVIQNLLDDFAYTRQNPAQGFGAWIDGCVKKRFFDNVGTVEVNTLLVRGFSARIEVDTLFYHFTKALQQIIRLLENDTNRKIPLSCPTELIAEAQTSRIALLRQVHRQITEATSLTARVLEYFQWTNPDTDQTLYVYHYWTDADVLPK
jgi:hypothetical protein